MSPCGNGSVFHRSNKSFTVLSATCPLFIDYFQNNCTEEHSFCINQCQHFANYIFKWIFFREKIVFWSNFHFVTKLRLTINSGNDLASYRKPTINYLTDIYLSMTRPQSVISGEDMWYKQASHAWISHYILVNATKCMYLSVHVLDTSFCFSHTHIITQKCSSGQPLGCPKYCVWSLQWRHNGHNGISHHQPHDCLLNCLFKRRSKKTWKLRVTGLCAGNSLVTGKFPHKWPVTRKMFPFDYVIMYHKFWLFYTIKWEQGCFSYQSFI